MRICSQDWNFSANIVGGMQAAFAQHVCRHSGGGRFAMHSSDYNSALGMHDCGECFGASDQRFPGIARATKNWIVVLNRGGKDNKLRSVGKIRQVLIIEAQAQPLQSIRLCGRGFVGAAHCVAELDKKPCKTAHTASSHANEVNRMAFLGEKSR